MSTASEGGQQHKAVAVATSIEVRRIPEPHR